MKPGLTDVEIKNLIDISREEISDYKEDKEHVGVRINPFTTIRHALFRSDPKIFSDVLYPDQKAAFIAWMKAEKSRKTSKSPTESSDQGEKIVPKSIASTP